MSKSSYEEQARQDFGKRADYYEMELVLNEPAHRHLKFRIGTSMIYGFDIVTWPGHLAITGDMGCFVFSRLDDMFEFFRGGRVNPDYWAEKIKAECFMQGGFEAYSPEEFRERVLDWFDDESLDSDLREELEIEVLSRADDGEQSAIDAAINFEWKGSFPMQDFCEVNVRRYTYHYLWCLHAIVWAISQYDKLHDLGSGGD